MKPQLFKILKVLLVVIILASCDMKSAQDYYAEAIELSGNHKHEEAILKLNKAIEKIPTYRMALIQRGYVKTTWLDDSKSGIEDFEKVLSFDADNTLALYYIGYVYGDQQQHAKAVEYLLKAKETEGVIKNTDINLIGYDENNYDDELLFKVDEGDINYQLGLQYVRLEQFDTAIAMLNKAVAVKTQLQDSYFLLGEAYIAKKDTINACPNFQNSARFGDQEAKRMLRKYCKRIK